MKNKMFENVGFKWVSLYHKKGLVFNKPFVIPLGFEPKTPSLKVMCSTS